MKRFGLTIVFAFILAIALVMPAHASTNDFTISNFEADYYLARDGAKRSTLKTVERITAEFPQFDQNHGIERALPATYDGHTTGIRIESVLGPDGASVPYSTREDNGYLILRIGEADKYVHGTATYVITYVQRDVTKYFANTNANEFYWDINGTQWYQTFGQVTARIHLSESLDANLTGAMACYYGYSGSQDRCGISRESKAITATISNLRAGQNMTVAIGFAPNTFAAYEPSAFEKVMAVLIGIWIMLAVVTSVIGVVLIFVISFRYSAVSNRKKDIGTVVPEYVPPKEASVLAAAQIGEGARASLTAQIIDLAVRHYVKMYQTKEKSLFKSAEYELEIIKPIDTLTREEQDFLTTLFGNKGTAVGARLEMKTLKSDYTVAAKMQKNTKALESRIKGKYGLRHKDEKASQWFRTVGIWTLVVGIVTVSPLLLVAAIIALVCASQLHPLTDKGIALRRYLMGLKLYIGVAEEERLKMLQSPEGVEKVGASAGRDPKKLIKLYERVLPYAVLFGQETEWNKQLGAYYEQTGSNPDWYSGHTAFSAVAFAGAMNDFSTSTNSYAVSSSSSDGGSSGGGSSGGGGGGGGGGGW